MAEYIDRESLIKNLNKFAPEHYNALINDLIMKEPAADVEPVRRGKWICVADYGESEYKCTNCHDVWYLDEGTPIENGMHYCHNCGAKMEEYKIDIT